MTTTTADRLAKTARSLDHAANCSPNVEMRTLFRVHYSMIVTLAGILADPDSAIIAADDWDRIARSIVREAAEAGLVDMGPYYAAERMGQS